jgi:predicted GNAT family acetyltransferase
MGENIIHNESTSRFEYIFEDVTAYLEYDLFEDVMDLTHTIVPRKLEGRGIGGMLVKKALDYAREQGYKVKPTCWFADKFIKKFPGYEDLVVEVPDDSHNGPVCEI